MLRKDRIYETLRSLCMQRPVQSGVLRRDAGFSAEEVAERAQVDRTNVSRDLNLLALEGKVIRIPGRPVLFTIDLSPTEAQADNNGHGPPPPVAQKRSQPLTVPASVQVGTIITDFDTLIGAQDGLKVAVQQAKAAVLYPPRGLHTLLCGPSGVGKTTFARLMHAYAIELKMLPTDAPFISFNCADYASTPQLLMIAANPPIKALADLLAPYQQAILVPFDLSFGLMALFLAFGVSYSLAQYRRTEPVQPGVLAMVVFLVASMPVTNLNNLSLGEVLPYLGGQGLLVAILVGIMTTEVMRFFRGSRFTIRLPKSVPPNVTRAFEALVPAVLLIALVWSIEWFVSIHTFMGTDGKVHQLTVPILLMRIFQPLVFVQDSYPAALLEIILMMLLWSVGIHGMNVVTAIALPFWLSTLTANATMHGHGIVTEPFFHIFAHLGGSGATWRLVIYMLRSRSAQLRTVGKVALGPAIFNINEPVTFGVPMALNPIMMIPFVLVPTNI